MKFRCFDCDTVLEIDDASVPPTVCTECGGPLEAMGDTNSDLEANGDDGDEEDDL